MQDHIPTQCCEMLTQTVSPVAPAHHEGVLAMCSEQLKLGQELSDLEVRVLNQTLSYVIDSWNFPMFLLDGLCNVAQLPTHSGEVVNPGMMTCDVGMVIEGGRSPDLFLKPFPKDPWRLPYILFITLQCVKCRLHITPFFCMIIYLSLGAIRRLLMVLLTLKFTWTPFYHKCSWNLCLSPLCRVVPYRCYCGCCSVVIVVGVGVIVSLGGAIFVVVFNSQPVRYPNRILAPL